MPTSTVAISAGGLGHLKHVGPALDSRGPRAAPRPEPAHRAAGNLALAHRVGDGRDVRGRQHRQHRFDRAGQRRTGMARAAATARATGRRGRVGRHGRGLAGVGGSRL